MKTQEANHWLLRHLRAFTSPGQAELGAVRLLQAMEAYAEHMEAMGYTLGTDGYAAPYFKDIFQAAIKLLSLDIGKLDGGSMDSAWRELAESQGLELDS